MFKDVVAYRALPYLLRLSSREHHVCPIDIERKLGLECSAKICYYDLRRQKVAYSFSDIKAVINKFKGASSK